MTDVNNLNALKRWVKLDCVFKCILSDIRWLNGNLKLEACREDGGLSHSVTAL